MTRLKLFSGFTILAFTTVPMVAQHGAAPVHIPDVAGKATGAATGAVQGAASASAQGKGSGNAHGGGIGGGLGAGAIGSLTGPQSSVLSARLTPLLPSTTTFAAASAGFANQGQFVSAVHVAHNLNVSFDQLKTQMTGPNAVSLGKAIQTLKPDLNEKAVKQNVNLADRQADRDLRQAQAGDKQDRVAARLASDSKLSSRLAGMLPSGMTVPAAAAGFKNEGQFIATLQASKNTGIPFTELKDRVTAGESLGSSIHALKPSVSEATAESSAKEAEEQAKGIAK